MIMNNDRTNDDSYSLNIGLACHYFIKKNIKTKQSKKLIIL